MERRSLERMAEITGIARQDDRDQLIYALWRKRFTYAQIKNRDSVSCGKAGPRLPRRSVSFL
jgi:hypothetical protein